MRKEDTLFPLGADFEPVAQVKLQVMAARWPLKKQRQNGEQRSEGNEGEMAMASHAVMVRAQAKGRRLGWKNSQTIHPPQKREAINSIRGLIRGRRLLTALRKHPPLTWIRIHNDAYIFGTTRMVMDCAGNVVPMVLVVPPP